MTQAESPSQRASRALQTWIFWLYLAFVIYGSLVPLQYVARPLDDALQAFYAMPFLSLGVDSLADWVANLLLFIPLTLMAALVLDTAGHGVRRALVMVVLACAACVLAVGIEFTQLFFPQRTVSQNDIFAESVGGLVGLVGYGLLGTRLRQWFDNFWQHQRRQDRVAKLLNSYLLVLLVFNVLPLDLTLSPVELFHKWREGRIVLIPFAGLKGGWAQALYETATDILIWVPAGWLWAQRVGSSWQRVCLRGLAAAAAIELMQLFVYSRVTDVTDVLMAGVGVLIGWAMVGAAHGKWTGLLATLPRHWRALWMVWVVFTLGVFWYPFNFDADGLRVSSAVAAFTRVPFTTYYFSSEFHALNELLRKVGFFTPGGMLLGFAAPQMDRTPRPAAMVSVAMLVALAVVVEVGQLALPGKVADLTDVMLESLGGLLGYAMARWINVPLPLQRHTPTRATGTRRSAGGAAHAVACLGLAMAIDLALRLPGMPYNLRELLNPGLGEAVSVLALALVVYGTVNGAFILFAKKRRAWFLAFPLALLAYGLVTWALLRVGVPMESLEDIVGAPVLGWAWEWEMLGRTLALYLGLALQLLGAALCVRAIVQPARVPDFVYWVVISVALAWPLHQVVVTWAATDNLTELMADNASFWASCALAGAIFFMCLAGSAVSAALSARSRSGVLLVLALGAAISTTLLVWLGTEHTIVKYDQVFSALQFLLSTDRAHYAQGAALALRYAVAFCAMCGAIAALQWLSWKHIVLGLD